MGKKPTMKKESRIGPNGPAYGGPGMTPKKGMALTHGAKGSRYRQNLPGVGKVGK